MSTLRLIQDTVSSIETTPLVRIVGLRKAYELGGKMLEVLSEVSFEIERGDVVALCGSSGSGKSTMLNLIGCIDSPTSGYIQIGDRRLEGMTDNEIAAFRSDRLGFIFQTFNLIPVLSAVENVEYPLLKKPMSRAERRALALETLKLVGLEKYAEHCPNQLSGGQRQRVAIARALVHKPEIVIADEPTANLDKRTACEILDLIADMNKRLGVTFVIATHDPNVMRRVGRTFFFGEGHIFEDRRSKSREPDQAVVAARRA